MTQSADITPALASLGATGWTVQPGWPVGPGTGTAGKVAYLDVTASRDYNSATDKGKVLRPSPTSSSFTVTVQTTSGQAAGDVFATDMPGTGKITVAAGGSITLTDTGGLQAAQAQHNFAIGFKFETTTQVAAG